MFVISEYAHYVVSLVVFAAAGHVFSFVIIHDLSLFSYL